MSADSVSDLAAGLSYRFLLALFPFFIFLAALGSFVARLLSIENPSTEIVGRLAAGLPADARSVLTTQLDGVLGEQQAGLLSFGIIGALWAASSAMAATMRAMNNAYDVQETRTFWKRTAIAVGLTLLSSVLLITAFVLAVGGEALGGMIARALSIEAAYDIAIFVLRYVFAIALLVTAAAFLFWAAPNAHLKFRWLTPGATMFIVVWLAVTVGFGLYVSRFGSYNATYGTLGGLIVLLIWAYLSAYIMLAGAELNALLARKHDPEAARELSPTDGADAQAQASESLGVEGAAEAQRRGMHGGAGTSDAGARAASSHRTGRAGRALGAAVALVALRRGMARARAQAASRQ